MNLQMLYVDHAPGPRTQAATSSVPKGVRGTPPIRTIMRKKKKKTISYDAEGNMLHAKIKETCCRRSGGRIIRQRRKKTIRRRDEAQVPKVRLSSQGQHAHLLYLSLIHI